MTIEQYLSNAMYQIVKIENGIYTLFDMQENCTKEKTKEQIEKEISQHLETIAYYKYSKVYYDFKSMIEEYFGRKVEADDFSAIEQFFNEYLSEESQNEYNKGETK